MEGFYICLSILCLVFGDVLSCKVNFFFFFDFGYVEFLLVVGVLLWLLIEEFLEFEDVFILICLLIYIVVNKCSRISV